MGTALADRTVDHLEVEVTPDVRTIDIRVTVVHTADRVSVLVPAGAGRAAMQAALALQETVRL